MKQHTLQIIDRELEDYSKTLSLQTNFLEEKVKDRSLSDMLVLVEHEPVYTVGRSVKFQDIREGKASKVKWLEVGRGGEATFHGPGQLVAYPVFDLHNSEKDVHKFLRKLEDVVIHCLAKYGIAANRREGLTGVWIQDIEAKWKKIASIGIGLRKWISYHGIAINLSPELSYFQAISPCGQDGNLVTSIAEHYYDKPKRIPKMLELKKALIASFEEIFEFEATSKDFRKPRPGWLKAKAPGSPEYNKTNELIREHRLVTVCEEAHCPNIGECWTHRTATFMIMGELCTRRCSFCAVKDGTLEDLKPLDKFEPLRVGQAVAKLGLKHIVVTSVNRDDIKDMGAEHFNATVKSIRHLNPETKIELLIPDMRGRRELVETILANGEVSVLNHNLETVPNLYKEVRPGAIYQRSLDILRWAKEIQPEVKTKSGLMLGLGESKEQVLAVMKDLRAAGCEILTLGQYLRPTEEQLAIKRYITPEEFSFYQDAGYQLGFSFVESGPLVRSSYHAWKHSNDKTEDGTAALERPYA